MGLVIQKEFEMRKILTEAPNLLQKDTGLPFIIFISIKGNSKHGPRIKVQNNYSQYVQPGSMFSVTVSDSPRVIGDATGIKHKDLNKVLKFVIKHKEAILALWNNEINHDEFKKRIEQ